MTETAHAASGFHIFDAAMIAYFAAYVMYALHAFMFRRRGMGILALSVLIVAFGLHTAFLVERALIYHAQYQGFVLPSVNMFESISFFCWLIVLLYFFVENWMLKSRFFGIFALALPVAGMAYGAYGMSPDPREMMPSLKSYWLVFHITAMFISYSAFALAFSFAIMYILRAYGAKGMEKIDARFNLKYLDEMGNKLILTGFPLLTVGIFLGAVWAHYAWGRYWGWDPKETWALVTWLIYLAYLHLRLQWNWSGYRSALFSIIGFASVIITFLGVNLLNQAFGLESIHAYAEGGGGIFILVVLGLAVLIPVVLHFLPQPAEETSPAIIKEQKKA